MRNMHFFIATAIVLLLIKPVIAQNVGIGTNNPRGPLSFPATTGQKIILWDDGNVLGNYYGIGVQAGVLQIHSYNISDDIVLGIGSSVNFTERMRVKGNGNIGMGTNSPEFVLDVANRMRIRSGGDLSNSAGLWLNRTDNALTQAFIGVEDNSWVGMYGGTGWSFGMNTTNGDVKVLGRLGIGTSTPNAPLTFPPALGKKITLYPGASGDVGMAVQGNLLQIYADNPNADVAFGYDQSGVFNERFRIRANGAITLVGNGGNPGQVLQSNGIGAASNWASSTNTLYNNTLEFIDPTENMLVEGVTSDLTGLTHTFTLTGNAKVFVTYNVFAEAPLCGFCSHSTVEMYVYLGGSDVGRTRRTICNGCQESIDGSKIITLGPGTHTIRLRAHVFGPNVKLGGHFVQTKVMNLQIIPQ